MRYVLFPGYVFSTDGDDHYIGAQELARLYGVNFHDCVVVTSRMPDTEKGYRPREGDVALRPRSDGQYQRIREEG